jgi:hypothetical protein
MNLGCVYIHVYMCEGVWPVCLSACLHVEEEGRGRAGVGEKARNRKWSKCENINGGCAWNHLSDLLFCPFLLLPSSSAFQPSFLPFFPSALLCWIQTLDWRRTRLAAGDFPMLLEEGFML